jgi:protease-4
MTGNSARCCASWASPIGSRRSSCAINSPGGTTGGGEALYHAIRDLSEKKPVVATIGTLGASAAYMTALASDRIYVRETSITGSIGVIFQWANLEELAETLGLM